MVNHGVVILQPMEMLLVFLFFFKRIARFSMVVTSLYLHLGPISSPNRASSDLEPKSSLKRA